MAELTAVSPASGLTPVATQAARLTEAPQTPIWSITPYRGQTAALSTALHKHHGLAFPAPGQICGTGAPRIVWAGLDRAFLIGTAPDAGLSDHAALTDQSDGWAHLILTGPDARAVLARFVPLDLSPVACPPGSARRTLLGHMQALILHGGDAHFEILVFRSMAATAVHDLGRAMRAVAARSAMGH